MPILAVAAACARGRTVMRGLAELRVKKATASCLRAGLTASGACCGGRRYPTVEGDGGPPEAAP